MQEVCGGGGGSGGGGDRKLRRHHHSQQQALNCPRCDSLNTKFCYYNNYNQSQPRHFCKNCRRYWTKGGVLRNVPVGGGNRKPSKRSRSKDSTAKARKSHSLSSSESSSRAAGAMAAAALTSATSEVASAVDFVYIIPDSRVYNVNPQASTTNPSFDSQPPPANHSTDGETFTDIGSFTSLENMLGFNTFNTSTSFDPKVERASFLENPSAAIMDQKVHKAEFAEEIGMTDDRLAAALDWGSGDGWGPGGRCGDEGLFDVTGTVDQAYWSDQSLNYLL